MKQVSDRRFRASVCGVCVCVCVCVCVSEVCERGCMSVCGVCVCVCVCGVCECVVCVREGV